MRGGGEWCRNRRIYNTSLANRCSDILLVLINGKRPISWALNKPLLESHCRAPFPLPYQNVPITLRDHLPISVFTIIRYAACMLMAIFLLRKAHRNPTISRVTLMAEHTCVPACFYGVISLPRTSELASGIGISGVTYDLKRCM